MAPETLVVALPSAADALTTTLVTSSSTCNEYVVRSAENAGVNVPGDTCRLARSQSADLPSSSVVSVVSPASVVAFPLLLSPLFDAVATVTVAPAWEIDMALPLIS